MRRYLGPILIALALAFGVDLCANATPAQKDAFAQAVRRTTTYRAVESIVPDAWFEAWTEDWRRKTAPRLPEDEGEGGG